MPGPTENPLDRFGGRCPVCDEEIDEAHARGSQIVLVPCGHTVTAMSALDVPEDELDPGG